MTAISVASFLQAASHPAQTDRRFLRSMWARGGVVPTTATFTDLKVTQRGAGANMSVDVAEGTVMVTGTEATYQGLYHGDNQGVTNVTITAANATNPRRDLIVARIKDTEYGVAVADTFSVEVKTGTAAASPVDPTVDANCVVLARVAVAANASSITNANITDLRNAYAAVTGSSVIGNQVAAVALGGVTPCTSSFRPTVRLYEGQVAYETDTDRAIVYNGSAWVALGAMAVPPPLFYQDSVSGGTATSATAFGTHNSILTAPYPLTMIVEASGDSAGTAVGMATFLSITDESGNNITQNPGGVTASHITMHSFSATSDWKAFSIFGRKDYTVGQTCGFRIRYHVSSNSTSAAAGIKVTFVPKAS